ncbi:gamma-glutamyltransferase [Hoeflea prorocentri]|uniref:Glutathione hydrolase proenzyme n=2 Tax=Hoeflea prorocentri TaxID=1922333 RepID=A0A9X3UEX8_9HYPH|nr:gamma-glutamyltransferase [Hoeflea prorocentri]MCY6379477.1 gamma-glutamyltransferase [Hoeflea prorocentri]MDA5397277.1 gamma-glutamyltransferase [Hoeflea prorocentri]
MAATSHPLATQAAIQTLQNGGNAMDAAIAACAVQCVVEPHSTGVGGDCFCLYAPEGSDELVAYNGSGRTPAATDADALLRSGMKDIPRYSPVSVTVPGAIDAWVRLLKDHGRLSLAEVLMPAIGYAEDGFPISPRIHFDMANQAEFLGNDPVSSATYLKDGKAPAVGSVMRLPQLARTMRAVAEQGSDVFYKGWIARDIVERLQELGGVHTMDDLARAGGEYVAPIASRYRDHTIHQCPPNGQGVIALLLLNMMQRFDIDPGGPLTADRIHLEIEACRLAYAARNHFVGDPEFSAVPVEVLLSDDYARKLAGSIDMSRATVPAVDIDVPRHRDTVYISVVDEDRNACSFINTLFFGFGSGITAPESGVTLHNRGQGFTLQEGHPNRIAPGKRPLHTIIPAMETKDGRAQMSFGVMGGQYQAFGHMQFLSRYHDFGLDLQEAMDAPRFMADPFNGQVEMENAIDADICEDLVRRGHDIATASVPIGGSQAIAIDWENNVLTGASDPRKDGCAIGY